MGLLNGTKAYLAGPIEYAGDGQGGIIWRNEITKLLHEMGVRVYDPMRKPDWYPPISKGDPGAYTKRIMKGDRDGFEAIHFIEKVDFRYVYDCDWLIVYLPAQRTYGTIDELRAAVNCGKPIFIFSEDGVVSSWVMAMVSDHTTYKEVFHHSLDELVEYIRRIDNSEVPLDPLKWIFLSYFNENVPLKPREEWSTKGC